MVFFFTEIDHPALFEKLGTPEADHILACQYFLIEEILFAQGVRWMQRTPRGLLAIFEGGDAGKAAVTLHTSFQEHLWKDVGKAKLRIAIHVGQAEPAGQGYVGPDFNHALKVLEAAQGSQILLTVAAVHFVPLPPGARLQDMGVHFLKDLSEPQNLYALLYPGLPPEENKPLLSLKHYPQNLFPQSSPFFGREEEMKEVTGLLQQPSTRVVTLLGPGGFGKTRLAFQAAAESIERFEDGVFQVALAPLLSDQLLVGGIANAIKFFFYGAEDPQTQLLNHLKEKKMLILLDNFEHIIEGAELVGEILKAAPGVKVLVTSRESLKIDGEKVIEVKGLRYPEGGQTANLEAFSAVQLFLMSAKRLHPQFALQPADREPLLTICRLLEGMPLGLELSATWVATLTLPQIADKIESSRDFLATSMPHLPPRHRSLRAVFEYSWILLSEPQKKVLRGVSVFKGSFSEQAARKVAGATEAILLYLVNKSLVRIRSNGRFEIHELLKYYAKEKLYDDPEEKERAMDAHCAYFSQLLQKKSKDFYGSQQKKALEELTEEIGNIREGWKRAVETIHEKGTEAEGYLLGLFYILEIKGWFSEAQESFRKGAEALLERFPDASSMPPEIRVLSARLTARWAFFEDLLGNLPLAQKLYEQSLASFRAASALKQAGFALSGLGIVSESQGHYEKAQALYEKSLEAYQKSNDRAGIVWSLNHLGHIADRMGQLPKAMSLIKKSLAFSEADKDERSRAYSYNLLGDVLHDMGHFEEARMNYQKGLSCYLETGDRKGIAWSFANLGREAEVLGDYAGARQMYQEGMAISREMGDLRSVAWSQNLLGFVGWAVGDYPEAFRLYEQGLALYREIGDLRGEAWTLDLMGNLRLAQREDQEAEIFYQKSQELLSQEGPNLQNKAWHLYHLGTLSVFRKNFSEAKEKFAKSLQHFKETQDALGLSAALIQLGETACHQKAYTEARHHFLEAMRTALQSRLLPFLVDGLIGIAQLLKAEGDERQAISFLMVALSHPTCRRQTKDRVVSFSLDLQSHFSPEDVEGAMQWAKASRLEDVVASWVFSHEKPRPTSRKKTAKKGKPKRKSRPSKKRK